MMHKTSISPFLRPLLIWIAGILIHHHFRPGIYAFAILAPVLAILTGSALASRSDAQGGDEYRPSGPAWSIAFGCILLFLAVATTSIHEAKRSAEGDAHSRSSRWAEQMRSKLSEPISRLSTTDDAKALLTAITLGSRESMSKNMKRNFSAAGAAHILSVSGFHVGLICGFASLLLSFFSNRTFGRVARFLLTMTAVWAFAIITGLTSPTLRAAITITLYLCAQLFSRPSCGYDCLFAAAFLSLLCNPFDLFDVGFQLSYLALLSILILHPRIVALIEVYNLLLRVPWESISIAIAAQIGVSFLCIYHFEQISTIFLIANLYIGMAASILLPLALTWFVVNAYLPANNILERSITILAENMVSTTESLARTPYASLSLHLNQRATIFCYALLSLSLYFLLYKNKPIPLP
ncbi:MAG: ComEC/Rec2 family competence protein [Tannerellaceae bacterium]|jgi:competence protein ComEC|nr:ComEC/Rec2 family competence protein [Tannerellaceae bacterium]